MLAEINGGAVGGLGLLAQFNGPGFPSGPPAIFMFFFVAIFVLIAGMILFRVVKGVSEWSNNNRQPVLTVPAKVVAKRTTLTVHSTQPADNNHFGTSSSTSYFATFEFSSNDRQEFSLSASEYGMLAEEDAGALTFQGTRYKGFQRTGPVSKPVAGAAPVPAREPLANEPGFCPYCGLPVGGDFKFCPQCGKAQPEYTAKS
jgi:hypothetical protein